MTVLGLFRRGKRDDGSAGGDATPLPADDARAVDGLVNQARALLARDGEGDLEAAYNACMQALERLPEPEDQWREAAGVFCVLGDSYFLGGDYQTALQAYGDAVGCPGALGDAQVHLRLGKARFELGERDRAADELCRAYLASAHGGRGLAVFESEDPKYLAFLKTRMDAPREGW